MEFKDYYKDLGVAEDASQQEIQKAYRKLARQYHPDINKEPDAEKRFKEIGEANEVLKDPDKRSKYDRFGSAWKTAQQTGGPPPGFEGTGFDFGGGGPDFGPSGFSSFFENLFGGAFRGGSDPRGGDPFGGGGPFGGDPFAAQGFRQRGRSTRAGRHVESTISLSLDEAAHGGRRKVTVADPLTGARKALEVSIPQGILPGQKIRLAGQGEDGLGGGPQGDLHMQVEIAPHPSLKLEGRDLHTTVAVTPSEAALGGTATFETLDGEVTVRIPPGSSSGRKIRLRGKGFPARSGAGDLYAEFRIVVPETLTERERELYEALAEASERAPRRAEAEKA